MEIKFTMPLDEEIARKMTYISKKSEAKRS